MKTIILLITVSITIFFGLIIYASKMPEAEKTIDISGNAFRRIHYYGEIEGCTVKFVEAVRLPNFWLVRCPGKNTVSTFYDTGGKHPKKVGSIIIEE